jgi:hypothetical protein
MRRRYGPPPLVMQLRSRVLPLARPGRTPR